MALQPVASAIVQSLLALLAALTWGTGNFSMGLAGQRISPRLTVFVGFGTGLVGALLFLSLERPPLTMSPFAWGALAGLTQGLGWLCFSRALWIGPFSLLAPITATTTTVLLFVIGVASGNNVGPLAYLGAGLALSGIVILTKPRPSAIQAGRSSKRSFGNGVTYALAAGLLFMTQSLALDQAGSTSTSLVVTGTGAGVVVLLALTLIIRPVPVHDLGPGAKLAALGGFIIFIGDVAYIHALSRGPLATAAVLGQLSPLFTVLLAQLLLRERLNRLMAIGVGCALIGAAFISAG